MKTYFLLFTFLFIVSACDAPQRTRAPADWVNSNSLDEPSNQSGTWNPSPVTGGTNSGTTTGTTTGSNPVIQNCVLKDYYSVDIGHFSVCQNTQDETAFKFKATLSSTTTRTCLIPTYKEANGSSTYIGQPQCTYTTAGQLVDGKLYKDRQGFSSYPINGVIVMKEPLLPEYIKCMHGYVNWPSNVCSGAGSSYCAYWIPRCPSGGRSNASCDSEARNYMGQLCTSFKTKYSNAYVDIKTR